MGTDTTPSGGTHRGFEHLEFATHTPHGPAPLRQVAVSRTTPRRVGGFYAVVDGDLQVNAEGGGDTGAPQVKVNPIPREWYHTDWVADRTIAWLDSLDADDDWFCWMSFPDPHHPWDPPRVRGRPRRLARRAAARGLPRDSGRAGGHPRQQAAALAPLVRRHARLQLRGAGQVGAGHADRRPGARGQRPQRGGGRAHRRGARPGADRDRGPRLGRRRRRGLHHRPRRAAGRLRPPVQRPVPRRRAHAAAAGVAAGADRRAWRRRRCRRPSASSTWRRRSARSPACPCPQWMEGAPAARRRADGGPERVLTEWDSELFGVDVHLRTITRDRWVVHRIPARATCTTAPRASSTTWSTTRCSGHNRWDDPALPVLPRRPASPTSGTASPSPASTAWSSRRPCEHGAFLTISRGQPAGPRTVWAP